MAYDSPAHPDFEAQARDLVAAQQAEHDRIRDTVMRGDGWKLPKHYDGATGADRIEYPKVETVEACAARLAEEHAKREAFRASPRGRFLTAIEALEQDHPAEAAELQRHYGHLYYSGFGKPGEPVQPGTVGRALRVLAPMDCMLAQDAELALADLLVAETPAVAA